MDTNSPVRGGDSVNTSVVRALDILEYMNTVGNPMTVAEICRSLALNRITCNNLIKTLIAKKYLYKNEKGLISLTGKLYVMGQIFREGFPIIEMFNTHATEICQQLDCFSHLVTFAGLNQGILLSQVPRASIYADALHLYVPLYCTGAGKVLLANQPQEISQAIVSGLEFRACTKNTITDKLLFTQELKKIKEQGYAVDNHEFKDDLFCVSAPIFNMDGTVNSAVSLTRLKITQEKGFAYYIPHVIRLAGMLSHASGFRNLDLASL